MRWVMARKFGDLSLGNRRISSTEDGLEIRVHAGGALFASEVAR